MTCLQTTVKCRGWEEDVGLGLELSLGGGGEGVGGMMVGKRGGGRMGPFLIYTWMREGERRGKNSTYTSKVGSLSTGCNILGAAASGDVSSASKARALPECFLKREFNIISVNVYYMIKINKYNIDYLYQQHILFKNDNKKKTKTPRLSRTK